VLVVVVVVVMVKMMTGLSGSAATGGGGSRSFEKNGLVPVVTAATAIASAFTTAATSSAVFASVFFDRFHFTYFDAQIGQPIVITPGATAPADISYYTANRHQLPPVIPKQTLKFLLLLLLEILKYKTGSKERRIKLTMNY